jgi:hypothetical protein
MNTSMNKEHKQLMSKEAAEEFTQSLSQIMSGGYQQILWADKQGIPEALGLQLPEWVQRIGGYIKYSIQERQKIVEELHSNGLSSPKIAQIVGAASNTIRNDMQAKGLPRRAHHRTNVQPAKKPPESPVVDSEGPSTQILDWAAQEGLESLLWQKVKDRVVPFWEELVESVDEDETSQLLETIYNYLGKYEVTKKSGH